VLLMTDRDDRRFHRTAARQARCEKCKTPLLGGYIRNMFIDVVLAERTGVAPAASRSLGVLDAGEDSPPGSRARVATSASRPEAAQARDPEAI